MKRLCAEHVLSELPSFYCYHGPALVMEDLHQHDDLELNILVRGEVTYLYRGRVFNLPLRRLVTFWGSTPHRIVHVANNAVIMVAQAPAAWVMSWDLPHTYVTKFLSGQIVMEPSEARTDMDMALLHTWSEDFRGSTVPYKTVVPEMQARLHRLASASTEPFLAQPSNEILNSQAWRRVEQVAHYVAEHFRDPLSIDDIATGVGLRPSYMMHLFRERCGVSVLEYLTSFRIAHAQFLLATTEANVLDIALESGFNSLSRFYAVFKECTGVSPAKYRRSFLTLSPPGQPSPQYLDEP